MDHSEEWPYTWEGRGGPFTILLGPGVFAPTRTSFEVAEGITINPGDTVIDVGSGSGVLSFVAARLGAGKVFGTEINPRAVEMARRNAALLGQITAPALHGRSPERRRAGLEDLRALGELAQELSQRIGAGRGFNHVLVQRREDGPEREALRRVVIDDEDVDLRPGGRRRRFRLPSRAARPRHHLIFRNRLTPSRTCS